MHLTRDGTLSDRTVNSYVRTIRAFWRWMHDEEYLPRTVMLKLKRPKLEQKYKDVLFPTEVEHLLRVCNPGTFLGSRMYALICLLYDSPLASPDAACAAHPVYRCWRFP